MWIVLLLVCLLGPAAWAQSESPAGTTSRFLVQSEPPEPDIYMDDQRLDREGASYQLPPPDDQPHKFLFRKPNYLDIQVTLSPAEMQALRQSGKWAKPVTMHLDGSVTVTFVTDPEEAQVYLCQGGSLSKREPLGLSGQGMSLPVSVLWDPETATMKDPVVAFEKPGYFFEPVEARGVLETGRWPREGAYRLKVQSAWVGALEGLQRYAIPLLLLLAATIWVIGHMLGLMKASGLARKREARLEEISRKGSGEAWTGAPVGGWRLVEKLADGKAAMVYRGVPDDTLEDSESVVVKVLREEHSHDADFRQRFLREMTSGARLEHPHICQIVDFGDQDGNLYLAREFVRGKTLRQMLQSGGVPSPQVIRIFQQVADALGFAHADGVLHRNLNPDNIMVNEQGRVKVQDFSFARTPTITPYSAPEQRDGGSAVKRSDIYSAGVILYELLTGHMPYEEGSTTPTPVEKHRPELPPTLNPIFARMLAMNPAERFNELHEAVSAISRALKGAPSPSSAAPAS